MKTESRSDKKNQDAFLRGLEILGLKGRDGVRLPGERGVFPQQLDTLDVLASGKPTVGVLEPRQTSKTTTIEAWLLGLCATTPGLQVAYTTGQTGKSARDHFKKSIAPPIMAAHPGRGGAMTAYRGIGSERVTFENGSLFQVIGSLADLRGSVFDIVWADESGELEGADYQEFISAAQPTQDTRAGVILENPLMIFSGTAGKTRKGNALWDVLERGRNGEADVAVIEYSAGVDLVAEDMETWDQVEALLMASHPGVQPGNLTTIERIRTTSYATMDRERFAREYLGIFGTAGTVTGIINSAKWNDSEVNADPERPSHFAIGYAHSRGERSAAIVLAWRVDGIAHIAVQSHFEGTDWARDELVKLTKGNPYAPVGYDHRGLIRADVDWIRQRNPRARFLKLGMADMATAAPLITKEIHTGRLVHYGDGPLTSAALSARRRELAGAWAFGTASFEDIAAIEAAALALLVYDRTPERKPIQGYFAA